MPIVRPIEEFLTPKYPYIWRAVGLTLIVAALILGLWQFRNEVDHHDARFTELARRECLALNTLLSDARATRIAERISLERTAPPSVIAAFIREEQALLDAQCQVP